MADFTPEEANTGYTDPKEKRLQEGLGALGLELGSQAVARLMTYLGLVEKWNRVHNLTAVRDPMAMIERHLLDSLAGLPFLPEGRLLDLGSGAGLPGIPIAIAEPERPVVLLDSAAKRTQFLIQVVGSLGLDAVEVVHARGEEHRPVEQYDVVVARAVTDIGGLVEVAAPLLAPQGQVVAWKGAWPGPEGLPDTERVTIEAVNPVRVPGLTGQRHIIVARPRLC